MTLFISDKNQQLLWSILNKNEDIKNLDTEFKSNWFKQTVGIYYEKYINTYLTTKNIVNINKEFIIHIKNDLKFIKEYNNKKEEENKIYIQEIESQQKYINEQQEKQNKEDFLKSYNTDKKDDDVSRNFHERQTEYTNLLTPKPPDDVDFSEKKDEDPITDISALLEKQQKERENMDKESNSMYEKYVTDNKLLNDKEELEVIEPS